MDLFSAFKSLLPDNSDDEVNSVVNDVKAAHPDVPDDQLAAEAAQTIPRHNDGSIYKDMAINQVKNKYGLEQRQALQDQQAQENSGTDWRAGLAALGAGLQGGNAAAAGQAVKTNRLNQQQNALADFDKKAGLEQQGLADASENDPNSEASKLAQNLAGSMGVDPSVLNGLTAAKFKSLSPVLAQKYKIEQDKLARSDKLAQEKQLRGDTLLANKTAREEANDLKRELAQNKTDEALAKTTEAKTQGQLAADKDYAKDYNTFAGGGAQSANNAIQKLKDLRKQLEGESKELFGAGGGTIAGSLPDWMRDTQSIALRDNIATTANSALKSTFGGQLSDGERKALVNEFYNDKLPPKENLAIMDRKIAELQSSLDAKTAQANYFKNNKGTLGGFDPTLSAPEKAVVSNPSDGSSVVEIKGKRYKMAANGDLDEIPNMAGN